MLCSLNQASGGIILTSNQLQARTRPTISIAWFKTCNKRAEIWSRHPSRNDLFMQLIVITWMGMGPSITLFIQRSIENVSERFSPKSNRSIFQNTIVSRFWRVIENLWALSREKQFHFFPQSLKTLRLESTLENNYQLLEELACDVFFTEAILDLQEPFLCLS